VLQYNFAANIPRFKRSYGGGFRFPQQAVGISPASLKRTDVRKISTLEIFLLMRYNFYFFKYFIIPDFLRYLLIYYRI
jgi:hypothetical protein